MFHRYTLRMTFPIVALSAGLLVGAVATGWYVHWLQQDASNLLSRAVASMRAAEELEIRTRELRTRLNQFLVTGDTRYFQDVPAMQSQIIQWLVAAEALITTPAERALTDKIRDGLTKFSDVYLDIVRRSDAHASTAELKSRVGQLIDERITGGILVHAHSFLDLNQQSIQYTIPVNQEAADRVGLGMAALGFLGSAAGVLVGSSLARQLSESLVRLTVPVHDAAGRLNEVVGPIELSTSTDNIEELKASLEALAIKVNDVVTRLQRSQRETLRAEQLAAVGQLAAGMAHELRNPLTAIKMIVQSAMEDQLQRGVSGKPLAVLYEQILRQERSISTFLEFARPPRLEPHQFDLREALRASVLLMSDQSQRQGVQLDCECPADAVTILGDAVQIRQLIVNLLINAIDALPQGGRVVTAISVLSSAEVLANTPLQPIAMPGGSGRWAVLRVEDNGQGLAEDLGDRIFEPFISTKETGMGLGLSICKRIVELHGGVIVARNAPSGGAVFQMGLPLADALSATTETTTTGRGVPNHHA